MPITITLSDEVAAELLAQLNKGVMQLNLRPSTPMPAPEPQDIYARALAFTTTFVNEMKSGDAISVRSFSDRYGFPTQTVSQTLQKMRDRGAVTMLQRGTWQKI